MWKTAEYTTAQIELDDDTIHNDTLTRAHLLLATKTLVRSQTQWLFDL